MSLQEYTFGVEYIPGVRNLTADCLTRLVRETPEEIEEENRPGEEDNVMENENMCAITQGVVDEELWKVELESDVLLQEVCAKTKGGWSDCDKKEESL